MGIQGAKTKPCDGAILEWQRDQYTHDQRNHFDILSLHKQDRLKHYAMHMAKYAGRVARGAQEAKPIERTFVDALLVSLSAANTLHQKLSYTANQSNETFLTRLTDAAGRMNDACEKIDHLEPFLDQLNAGNQDVFNCLLDLAAENDFDPDNALQNRRKELSDRHFYIR
jgi:hypothetical protein